MANNYPQDVIREPRVRLFRVLTLLRFLAGRRGSATVTWHGAGFTYTLTGERDPGADPATSSIDADLDTGGLLGTDPGPLLTRLAQHLEVHP